MGMDAIVSAAAIIIGGVTVAVTPLAGGECCEQGCRHCRFVEQSGLDCERCFDVGGKLFGRVGKGGVGSVGKALERVESSDELVSLGVP